MRFVISLRRPGGAAFCLLAANAMVWLRLLM
jgi:hypothetical protein